MVAVTKQKGVPSIEFSTAEGNLEREKEAEDTMLDLLQPLKTGTQERDASSSTPTARRELSHEVAEEKPTDEELPSVVTDAGRMLWLKIRRVRKESSAPNQEESTMCSLIIRKIPIVKSVTRQKQQGPGVE